MLSADAYAKVKEYLCLNRHRAKVWVLRDERQPNEYFELSYIEMAEHDEVLRMQYPLRSVDEHIRKAQQRVHRTWISKADRPTWLSRAIAKLIEFATRGMQ